VNCTTASLSSSSLLSSFPFVRPTNEFQQIFNKLSNENFFADAPQATKQFVTQTLQNPCASPSCSTNNDCGYGSSCIRGTCGFPTMLACNAYCNHTTFRDDDGGYCYQDQTCDPITHKCSYKGLFLNDCSCTSSDQCVVNCIGGVCSLSGSGAIPAGVRCSAAADCASGTCTNNLCVGLPANSSCLSDEQCGVGLRCFFGQCNAFASKGQSCVRFPCGGSSFCDPNTRTCKPLFTLTAGANCSGLFECQVGLIAHLTLDTGGLNCYCTATPDCHPIYSSSSCSPGQSCQCTSPTSLPQCVGPTISQTCANLLIAYLDCSQAYPQPLKPVGATSNSFSTYLSPQCLDQYAAYVCDSGCLAQFGAVLNADLFSCKTRRATHYTIGAVGCSSSYCFNLGSGHSVTPTMIISFISLFFIAIVNRFYD